VKADSKDQPLRYHPMPHYVDSQTQMSSYINPHYFSAILGDHDEKDNVGVPHRFVLVLECESRNKGTGHEKTLPRFSVGKSTSGVLQDPRLVSFKQLYSIGIESSPIKIPPSWLMAHQYLYIVHGDTDENGWQYRSAWSEGWQVGPKDEPWTKESITKTSAVRRRMWMTTIVPRDNLLRARRLLAENLQIDDGRVRLEGNLLRYEKGTLTKSWNKRKVVLYHNRIEFYRCASDGGQGGTGMQEAGNKKGEVRLVDCEIKMLLRSQCPGQKDCVFSIRNPSGSVGILLDAESKETRRRWVMAIQYQLAATSPDVSFPPLEFAPPVGGSVPDTRVLFCGELELLCNKGAQAGTWSPRYFQLLPRELVYFQDNDNDKIHGRVFIDRLNIFDEEEEFSFKVKSASGITFVLDADSQETKSIWLLAIRKQVQCIENQKLKVKTSPKEEQNESAIPLREKIAQFYDDQWTATPPIDETEQYLTALFSPASSTNPAIKEFSNDVDTSEGGEVQSYGDEGHAEQSTSHPHNNSSNNNANIKHTKTTTTNTNTASAAAYNTTTTTTTTNNSNITNNHDNNPNNDNDNHSTISEDDVVSRNNSDNHLMEDQPSTNEEGAAGHTASLTVSALQGTHPAHTSGGLPPTYSSSSSASSTTSSSSGVKVKRQGGHHSSRSGSSRGGFLQSRGYDPKRSLMNPKLILGALKAPQAQGHLSQAHRHPQQITHRFVLILECERSTDLPDIPEPLLHNNGALSPTPSSTPPSSISTSHLLTPPSRFSVGGPRACKDPRNCPLKELLGISNRYPEIQLPTGWLMLHQYINVIQQNTDEHGWQYRSKWSNGLINGRGEEQWGESPGENRVVRRRLWMTTVVKKDDLARAKKIIVDSLVVNTKGEQAILQGTLYRHQLPIATDGTTLSTVSAASTNSIWQKVKVLLFHGRIELFIGNDKRGDYPLLDCEVKMFFDQPCFSRPYSFSLRNYSGSVNLIMDAETREKRLQWVSSIHYQLAVISPDLNFPPFVTGPPAGMSPNMRVLMCGELGMASQGRGQTMMYYFELEPSQLRYYERTVLKGRMFLNQMVVSTHKSSSREDDSNSDFIIRTPPATGSDGVGGTRSFHLRAPSPEMKHSWVRSIKRQQVQYIESMKQKQRVADAMAAVQSAPLDNGDATNDDVALAGVAIEAVDNIRTHQLLLMMTPSEHRRHQFFDHEWTAPDEDAEDEEHLLLLDARREDQDQRILTFGVEIVLFHRV
jgi:hypothetical protein